MTYRFLSGTFGYSKNSRALALYSGTIGAFLQPQKDVNAQTIHSALRIRSSGLDSSQSSMFSSPVWHDTELQDQLRTYNTIIIDEIFMVSSDLMSYFSDFFGRLHNIHRPFGNLNVILVGDLFQLPPVAGSQVFHLLHCNSFIH